MNAGDILLFAYIRLSAVNKNQATVLPNHPITHPPLFLDPTMILFSEVVTHL